MGWKVPLSKWHTFWMALCLICYFIVILFYIERKWLFMRNVAIILSKYWKIVEFRKSHLKWKIVIHFTRPKQRVALRNLFSPSPPPPAPIPPDEILLCLRNKNFLTEIYRNIQTFAFKVLHKCSSCVSGNGAVQMFLTPNRNMFAGKFVNWEIF